MMFPAINLHFLGMSNCHVWLPEGILHIFPYFLEKKLPRRAGWLQARFCCINFMKGIGQSNNTCASSNFISIWYATNSSIYIYHIKLLTLIYIYIYVQLSIVRSCRPQKKTRFGLTGPHSWFFLDDRIHSTVGFRKWVASIRIIHWLSMISLVIYPWNILH